MLAQHRHGHLDVRKRRHGLTAVAQVDTRVVTGAGQQQRRDKLAGLGCVDRCRSSWHRAGPVDDERQTVAALIVDGDTQRPQRRQDGAHRPLAGALVAVELDPTLGERGDRGDETHHGPGQATIDRGRPAQPARRDRPVGAVVVDPYADGAQRVRHQFGVTGPQGPAYPGPPVGEGGEDEGAVGDRLRAREPHRARDGTGRIGCGPGGRCGRGLGHRGRVYPARGSGGLTSSPNARRTSPPAAPGACCASPPGEPSWRRCGCATRPPAYPRCRRRRAGRRPASRRS